MTKGVAFYTLGCKLNYAESATLLKGLAEKGYREVAPDASPEAVVINTCSVTENADRKCRRLVRLARRLSPRAHVVVIGCYAQLQARQIAAIPGVSAVLGAREKFGLAEHLASLTSDKPVEVHASNVEEATSFHPSYSLHGRTRAFLKVQDGCDYSCSFCTIPQARGKSRSGDVEELTQQAEQMGQAGVKEIVLTGVNIGDFGRSGKERTARFIDLINALEKVRTVARFRISSIEPNLLTDEIIQRVAHSERFAPHFHVPLQSGSPRILRLMRRRYTRDLYAARIAAIREAIPNCCIGADVIVGFPQETKADFHETQAFLRSLPISYLHVFPYSERERTPAAAMPHAVTITERQQRATQLRMLSEKKRRAFYQAHRKTSTQVLFERDIRDGRVYGFTPNYIRTGVSHRPEWINALQTVQLDNVDAQGFMQGRVVATAPA